MKSVLGLGNALVDILIQIDNDALLERFSLPKGSMTLVDIEKARHMARETEHLKKSQSPGGSAANTIYGLARMGVPTGYIGSISNDRYGELFKKGLEDHGTRTFLNFSTIETGRATTFISKDSERTFGTYLGAAIDLKSSMLHPEQFKGFQFLHFEGYMVQDQELVLRALHLAGRYGLKTSIDLASFNVVEEYLDFFKHILNGPVDIVFANEEEAKSLTGEDPVNALDILAQGCELAVVKTGSGGSLINGFGKKHTIRAIEARVVDTTGAGDLYAAGFLYGLIHDFPLEKCGHAGSVLAGKTIEYYGAKMGEDQWPVIKSMFPVEI